MLFSVSICSPHYSILLLLSYLIDICHLTALRPLVRFSALSRAIEAALQQESVPSRVLGGHKFFERAEVKDVLVYLQLADNPAFTPAFVRVVNVPRRGVGEKVQFKLFSFTHTKNAHPPLPLTSHPTHPHPTFLVLSHALSVSVSSNSPLRRSLRGRPQRRQVP